MQIYTAFPYLSRNVPQTLVNKNVSFLEFQSYAIKSLYASADNKLSKSVTLETLILIIQPSP